MSRRRWKDNIKKVLEELGWDELNLFDSGSGPVTDYFEHGNKHSGFIKCGECPYVFDRKKEEEIFLTEWSA
jgi:hypothetical protein